MMVSMPARELPNEKTADHARSSRRRYKGFVGDYKAQQLDAATDARDEFRRSKEPTEGTEETGAVRVSFGYFNGEKDAEALLAAIEEIRKSFSWQGE